MALGQNGVGAALLPPHHDDEDDDEDAHAERLLQLQQLQHLQSNGVCRSQVAPDSVLDRL